MKAFKSIFLVLAALAMVFLSGVPSYAQASHASSTEIREVISRKVTLASLARDTTASEIFSIAADSVAFVVESSVDSVSAVLRIEYCTATGATDGTAFASLTAAATKPTAGRAFAGNAIVRRAALTHARVRLITRNEDQSSQTITIKVYRIRVP